MKPMDGKKFCVTFAGAVGSSKTPVTHYLSCAFCLPILSNDAIRTEVKAFLERHGADVALHISDATFGDRTELSGKALRQWLI